MLRTITKDDMAKIPAVSNRSGNLEFQVARIRGIEYLYFRIGSIVAQRAGLKPKDKVILAWDDETGFGAMRPAKDGWALQSGNLKVDDPPLVLRVTRKVDEKNPPYLEKMGVCKNVKALDHSLEFYFPEGTTFGAAKPKQDDELYDKHRRIVERERRPTRKDELPLGEYGLDGKPYRRRATDRQTNGQ